MAENKNFYQILELRVVDTNEGTNRPPNIIYSFYMMVISKTSGLSRDRRKVCMSDQEFQTQFTLSERMGLLLFYQKSMENIGKDDIMKTFSSKRFS